MTATRNNAGPIGRLVDRLGLKRYMAKIIRERNAFLKAAAETQHRFN